MDAISAFIATMGGRAAHRAGIEGEKGCVCAFVTGTGRQLPQPSDKTHGCPVPQPRKYPVGMTRWSLVAEALASLPVISMGRPQKVINGGGGGRATAHPHHHIRGRRYGAHDTNTKRRGFSR